MIYLSRVFLNDNYTISFFIHTIRMKFKTRRLTKSTTIRYPRVTQCCSARFLLVSFILFKWNNFILTRYHTRSRRDVSFPSLPLDPNVRSSIWTLRAHVAKLATTALTWQHGKKDKLFTQSKQVKYTSWTVC